MFQTGVPSTEARIELIEGEVVDMAPIGTRHCAAVNRSNRGLVAAVGDRGIVSVRHALRLDDESRPQPDVLVLAPRADSTKPPIRCQPTCCC